MKNQIKELVKSDLDNKVLINTDSVASSVVADNSTCHSSETASKHPLLRETITVKGGFIFEPANIYRPCISCADITGLCKADFFGENPKNIICLSETNKIDELVKAGKYKLTTLHYKEFELPWLHKIEERHKELQEYNNELDNQLDDETEEEDKPWDDHLAVPEEVEPELPDNSKEQEFIFNWYETPIRDKAAALKQLRAFGRKPGDTYYCKKDNKIPYECHIGELFFNSEGGEEDWETAKDWCITGIEKKALRDENREKILNENGNTIWIDKRIHDDFLTHAIDTSNNGVEWFIIPAHQNSDGGGIQAVNSSCTYVCFTERDGSRDKSYEENVEEQKKIIELTSKKFGIVPKQVNSSGGKSLHNFIGIKGGFNFSTEENRELYRQLMRMLCIAYQSDPKITNNSNREMRLAGTFRKAKGNYQEILLETNFEYSIEELFLKLKPQFPHGMSKERFDKYCKCIEKLNNLRKDSPELLTPEYLRELDREYKNILNCPEDKLNEPKNRKSQKYIIDTSNPLNNSTAVPLFEMIAPWCKDKIRNGVTEGGRNNEGFKIAAHLISTKVNSEKLGIKTTDDEEDIFFTYANNCDPPLPDAEASSIWNSAQQRVKTDDDSLKKGIYFANAGKWLRANNPEEWERIKPKAEYKQSKEDWKAEYEIQRKERARFKFTRTPDILIREGYFPNLKLEDLPKGIIGFKGGQGTSKTGAMNHLTNQFYGKKIQIGHLNTLLRNAAKRSDLVHHHDLKEDGLLSRDRIAITDISTALHLNLLDYKPGEFILRLDEIEQVLESMVLSPILKGNRLNYRKKLEWLIRNAAYVFVADADLSDATLEWLETVRNDGKKAFIIQNLNKIGTGRKIGISTNKGATLRRLYKANEQKLKLYIPSEELGDLKVIEKELESKNNDFIPRRNLFIHGDNSSEDHIVNLIRNIDKTYLENDVFGCTNTLGTGVDLSTKHFDKCFALFTGSVFAFNQQIQILKRYRPEVETEIYCDPIKRTLPIDPEQIKLSLISAWQESEQYFAQNIQNLIDEGWMIQPNGEIPVSEHPYLKLYSEIVARKNASRANPLQTLKDELTELGYEIEDITEEESSDNKDELDKHKKIKSDMKDEEDLAIAKSQLLTDAEYDQAEREKGSLSKEMQRRFFKTRLHKTLGIEINAEIVKMERTKKLSRGVRLLHVLLTDEATAKAYEMRDRKNNQIITDRTYWLKARETLIKLKIPDLLAHLYNGGTYTSGSDPAKAIAWEARKNHRAMEKYLGIKINFAKVGEDKPETEQDTKTDANTQKGKDKKPEFKQTDTEIVGLILNRLALLTRNKKPKNENRTYSADLTHWKLINDTVLPHIESTKPEQAKYYDNQQKIDEQLQAEVREFNRISKMNPQQKAAYEKDKAKNLKHIEVKKDTQNLVQTSFTDILMQKLKNTEEKNTCFEFFEAETLTS